MRHTRAIDPTGASTEALSSGLASEQLFVTPSVELTDTRSMIDAGAVEGTAGPDPGEASPTVPPVAFDVAAVLCGHNIRSEVGVENARHDFRVWDLAEAMRP